MSTELLRAENIVKTFGPTKALQGVDFTLYAGEIRGLIGENGSGKSTLCSICGGIYGCDSGELYLKGEPYHPTSMVDAQKKGFAQILQEMGTISGIKVADNIFIGKEKLFTKGGFVNRKAMYKAAKEDPYRLKKKSVRGGSWKDPESYIRSAWRTWEYQNQPRSYIGFRCVRSLANTTSTKQKQTKSKKR